MGYNESSNAYDLSLFERRQPYVRTTVKAEANAARAGKASAGRSTTRTKPLTAEEKAEAKEAQERREARSRLARILAVGIIFVITITMLVGNRVEYHELTMDIENANSALTELEHEYEALRLEFDNKMSDSAVVEYAVNELGMQKRERSQTEYIRLDVGNVFEIAGQQTNDWYQTNLEKILSYED